MTTTLPALFDIATDIAYYRAPRPGKNTGGAAKRVLGADASRAVGRFRPEGPLGYISKSMPDAPLRATRAEARADELAWLEAPHDARS